MPHLYTLTNPTSGPHPSPSLPLLLTTIQPHLDSLPSHLNLTTTHLRTHSPGDGTRLGAQIRRESLARSRTDAVNVLLLGGDGTTHELLNGFFGPDLPSAPSLDHHHDATPPARERRETELTLNLILVPTGSANALYAACFPPHAEHTPAASNDDETWRLSSFHSFLRSLTVPPPASHRSHLVPLTLQLTTTLPPSSPTPHHTLTHLITSHALHASILYDSESPHMRTTHPGTARFKVAAHLNSSRWTHGSLTLRPPVSQYHPASHRFLPLPPSQPTPPLLAGPFLYLAALTTDRLEPHFVPAPFSSTFTTDFERYHPVTPAQVDELQRPPSAVDVVVIRPRRDPRIADKLAESGQQSSLDALSPSASASTSTPPPSSLQHDDNNDTDEDIRIEFAKTRLVDVTKGMYDGGKHVNLVYDQQASDPSADQGQQANNGPLPIVEYYRTGGCEFVPDANDARSALTCLDGATLFSQRTTVSVWGTDAGASRAFVWT